ncbi:DUF7130 family rubredoxin-like protein [Salinigranum marinum]|uniref:DUF7130 family rubredoxin-like protein n=1 Tax=Salinigranum marinum TaxID=1515595 RepID=UPI002989FBB5|nr:hypothetical protein [Salinigranum marinum]
MAIRLPSPMTPGRAETTKTAETGTRTQRLVELASEEPSAVTASRAVRPPALVRNKHLADDGFGEAYLVWRCLDCGTVGSLDALPMRCVCGARREALAYVVED